jgi:hypothetical protein
MPVLFIAALVLTTFAAEARAGFNVAYINANGGSVDYLSGAGINVTYLNNPTGLTLAQLAPYDAILISPNGAFSEATNIGNVAADFADSGRGVVLTAFDLFLFGGKIMTPSYSPLNLITASTYFNTVTLGTVFDSSSPILNGVNPLLATAQYDVESGLNPGATLVADWGATNQFGTRHAVAYTPLAHSSVVFVNLFPRGDSISSDSATMVANALKFSAVDPSPANANPVPVPPTFIMAAIGGVCLLGVARRRRIGSV